MPSVVRLTRRTLLAATVGLVAGACLPTGGESNDPPELATTTYPGADILATTDWLAEQMSDPRLRLVDCSSLRSWRRDHLPGARHVWWQDTIEIHNQTYGMLTGAEGRQRILSDAGISADSCVVCYDRSGGVWASRVLWMLHASGFRNVRLLDGGEQAWRTSGHADSRAAEVSGDPVQIQQDESVIAHGADIAGLLDRPEIAIIDTRTESERRETWFDRLQHGTIPNSHWLPRDAFLTTGDSPALVAPDLLEQRLADAGVSPDAEEVIVFGLHGTLACLPYVACRALGRQRVRVYDGSWAEWGAQTEWQIAPI